MSYNLEQLWRVFCLCHLFAARKRVRWRDIPHNLKFTPEDWVLALRIHFSIKDRQVTMFSRNSSLRLMAKMLLELRTEEVITLNSKLMLGGKEISFLRKLSKLH